ncbi:MAG: hypothetical protein ACYCTE_17885, partial [Acidimicrobiales bacterium]
MSRTARLWVVLSANLALVGALLAIGLTAHSLGVWAEGADYLADAAADAAAAAGVAVTGGIIYATSGNYWLDPTVALVIAAVVG